MNTKPYDHVKKIWPEYFIAILEGRKTWELRSNEGGPRLYSEGQKIMLREWDQETKKYTGRTIVAEIGYVLEGWRDVIDSDYNIFSLIKVKRGPDVIERESP
jgi:hypothetical protein